MPSTKYLDESGLAHYDGTVQGRLDEKADDNSLATVAKSGDYGDLDNTPDLSDYATKDYVDDAIDGVPTYSLPTMSPTTKGGAKLGDGLHMDGDALNLGPLTDSGSGASVQTDGCGIFGVTGEGWSEQDTTTGKNLAEPYLTTETTSNGVKWTYANNVWRANRTSTGSSPSYVGGQAKSCKTAVLAAGTYTASAYRNGQLTNVRIGKGEGNAYVASSDTGQAVSFTVPSGNTDYYYISSYIAVDDSGNDDEFEIMVELGSTATAYEPYTGGKASPSPDYPQEIRVARGRNLLPPHNMSSQTVDGVTLTVNTDGSVTANGTATASIAVIYRSQSFVLVAGTYVLSGCPAGGGSSTYKIDIHPTQGDFYTDYGNGVSFTTGNMTFTECRIVIYSGTVCNNLVFKPQIELGSQATPYVPYGHVGLEVQGKNNLLNLTRQYNGTNIGTTNMSGVSVSNQTITFTATASNPYYGGAKSSGSSHKSVMGTLVEVEPGTTYVVSSDLASYVQFFVTKYNASKVSLGYTNNSAGNSFSFTTDATCKYVTVRFGLPNATASSTWSGHVQLELGSTAHAWQPYHHTTTPIPLPSKGWAGAAGSYKDALSVDSAGRYEWTNGIDEHVFVGDSSESWNLHATIANWFYIDNKLAAADFGNATGTCLSSHFRQVAYNAAANAVNGEFASGYPNSSTQRTIMKHTGCATASDFKTWLASNNVTVMFPLKNPTAEHGYIQLPELPAGATVSIPELEAIGVEWWVEGTEAMAEHGRDVSKANKEQEDRIAELEAAVANLATS